MKRSLEMFISFHRSRMPLSPVTMLSTNCWGVIAGRGGLVLDLLAVLVGAGQEHHVVALQPLVARHGVGGHGAVGVADVQLVRGVVDRRGDIEFFLFSHDMGSSLYAPPEWKAERLISYIIKPKHPLGKFLHRKIPNPVRRVDFRRIDGAALVTFLHFSTSCTGLSTQTFAPGCA